MEVKWHDHGNLASNMKNTLNILVSSSLEGLSLAQFAQFIHWYSTFAFAGSFFKILFFFFPVLAFGFDISLLVLVLWKRTGIFFHQK
jgi:hypothetical protein